MYIPRIIEEKIKEAAVSYRILSLLGSRQVGKTRLVRHLFPEFSYLNLESPDIRLRAKEDPKSLFSQHGPHIILDEVQRVPELLSYIQVLVDEPHQSWRFVLTGSQSMELSKHLAQSLAGRVRIFKIPPFSLKEIKSVSLGRSSLDEQMFYGFYPRIYDENLSPTDWLASYVETYVERDVRQLMNIKEVDEFDRFIRLCAGRVGQLVNFSQLANEAGVTQPTAQSWLMLLKTSFLVFSLTPHFKNFNKRIIKTPKIYFWDTGLLCYLLKIKIPEQLFVHPLRGQIFENFVMVELQKGYMNDGSESPLYFWRDQKGHEVDAIIDEGVSLFPIEIKSGTTFRLDFCKGITYLNQLQNKVAGKCIYGGNENFKIHNIDVVSWESL